MAKGTLLSFAFGFAHLVKAEQAPPACYHFLFTRVETFRARSITLLKFSNSLSHYRHTYELVGYFINCVFSCLSSNLLSTSTQSIAIVHCVVWVEAFLLMRHV